MPTLPNLTDRLALNRNRARARRAPAFFLHEEVLSEAQQRLIGVNRTFKSPAIITPFAEIWQDRWPDARIVADDEVLALEPGAHDLVIHALALHWANDPVGQLVQCRRALRPDGLFLGFLFGGQTLAELRACLAEAEAAATGGLSPRVLPMAEIRELGALLQRAGFALPVADSLAQSVSYRDAFHLMADLRAMGEGNALAARLRRFSRRAVLADACARYGATFADPDGRINATFEIICLTGWAAHESQQKPLRPGSAVHRLADALAAPDFVPPKPEQDG
ncbi:MAG: methyltransferase domain-containing protein [Pseudorhodobacter sp.]|nr:methyltransferase domain-containing protein [Pseudorhodobacter sp.]